jgi:hypothetical protein
MKTSRNTIANGKAAVLVASIDLRGWRRTEPVRLPDVWLWLITGPSHSEESGVIDRSKLLTNLSISKFKGMC